MTKYNPKEDIEKFQKYFHTVFNVSYSLTEADLLLTYKLAYVKDISVSEAASEIHEKVGQSELSYLDAAFKLYCEAVK